MAPEAMIATAASRDPRADVYMFGVTLFELYTYGAHPWAGLPPSEVILRVAHQVRCWVELVRMCGCVVEVCVRVFFCFFCLFVFV